MKRNHLIILGLFVSCGLLLQSGCQNQAKSTAGPLSDAGESQQEAKAAAQSDKPAPKITFETMGYDFGEVGPDSNNVGQIKFTNTGEGKLIITKIGGCCGVRVTADKDPMEYAPGESGALQLRWRSGSYPTTFTRQFPVHSNDPVNPITTLGVNAKIVNRIAIEPNRLKLFLDETNAGAQKITVRSLDDKQFSITGFASTGDCISADIDPSVEAAKFVIEAKVNTEKLQKNLKGRITITTTHPEGKSSDVLFDVLPKYTVSPPLLIIFNAEPEKPTLRKISILNNYRNDFEIESVTSKGNIVGVKMVEQKKIANGYQLEVELTPPAAADKVRFTDTFNVNLKGGEKLPITCNGWYASKKTAPATASTTGE